MATKLARLKREARSFAMARGHQMSPFKGALSGDPNIASAECTKCHRCVIVYAKPPPNGIEIGGSAVAINCHSMLPALS